MLMASGRERLRGEGPWQADSKKVIRPDYSSMELRPLEAGEASGQSELQRKRRLEACVTYLWGVCLQGYRTLSGNVARGRDEGVLRNRHLVEGFDVEGFADGKKRGEDVLNRMAVEWGDSEGERIDPQKPSTENPAFSWKEAFGDDIMSHSLIMVLRSPLNTGERKDEPLDTASMRLVLGELEKTGRELTATGLIIAKGDVMDKWDYWSERDRSSLPRAVEKLNCGKPVGLAEVSRMVGGKNI